MKLNKVQTLIVIIVSTLFFFALITWLFEDFVWNQIVTPIYSFFLIISLVINAIPQWFYVALLVGIGAVLALRALTRPEPEDIKRPIPSVSLIRPSRYETWRGMVINLDMGQFSRETFALELRRLLLTILAYQEGIEDPIELQRLVQDGSIPLPPEVASLVNLRSLPEPQYKSRWIDRLMEPFGIRLTNKKPYLEDQEVAYSLEKIINFIEIRLEVDRGNDKL